MRQICPSWQLGVDDWPQKETEVFYIHDLDCNYLLRNPNPQLNSLQVNTKHVLITSWRGSSGHSPSTSQLDNKKTIIQTEIKTRTGFHRPILAKRWDFKY